MISLEGLIRRHGRLMISDITPQSCHFEQSFSADGGTNVGSELGRNGHARYGEIRERRA
jgi:hypothetical protein